jgi:GNAT superfamily N-acetyltransferase
MKTVLTVPLNGETDFVPVCTAAVTSAANTTQQAEHVRSAGGPTFIPSRLFGYSLCKKLDGISGAGSTSWWAHRVAKGYGFCEERLFPYASARSEADVPNLTISGEAFRNAYGHRFFAYQRLFTINDVKRVFARPICNLPLLPGLSFDMFEGIYEAPNGYVPVPKEGQKRINRHCVAIVGYDENQRVFHFLNSWGSKWGEQGFGHLPYEYFSRGLVTESWAWFPMELWKPLRSLRGEVVFRDKKNERVRAVVSQIPPPAWGRPMLWVIDLYDREWKILGWAHCSVFVDRDILEIEELFIKPEYRRRGLGDALIAQIDRIAKFCVLSKLGAWIPNQDVIKERDGVVRSFFGHAGFTVRRDNSRAKEYYWYRAESTILNYNAEPASTRDISP